MVVSRGTLVMTHTRLDNIMSVVLTDGVMATFTDCIFHGSSQSRVRDVGARALTITAGCQVKIVDCIFARYAGSEASKSSGGSGSSSSSNSNQQPGGTVIHITGGATTLLDISHTLFHSNGRDGTLKLAENGMINCYGISGGKDEAPSRRVVITMINVTTRNNVGILG